MNFCFVKSNEGEFIQTALELGLKEICLVYSFVKDIKKEFLVDGLKIYFGVLYNGKKIDKKSEKIDFVLAEAVADDPKKTRNIIETGKIDLIYNLENNKEQDFIHFRNSGMNQVIAKICKQKKAGVLFNFNLVLAKKNRKRALVLGRMQQNSVLCKKYKVKTVFGNIAEKPLQLRNEKALKAFESLF